MKLSSVIVLPIRRLLCCLQPVARIRSGDSVRSIMECEKMHIRHCLLHYFRAGKSAAETRRIICGIEGENTVTDNMCKFWFSRFRTGDFDLNDKPRSGRPQEVDDDELQALLRQNAAQSTRELAIQLGVNQTTVVRRLHALGKVQKEGRWVPHQLSESAIANRLSICTSLLTRQKRKSFLHKIVTGDEKWIFYDNPDRKAEWLDPGQASSSTPKRNIHGHKVLLCIWWDAKGVLYYELLKPNETVTGDRYANQLMHLSREIDTKREWKGKGRRKVTLLHDNARPHVASVTQQKLTELGWEILPHPAYSPDIAPSDYHLFRSMQHSLAGNQFATEADVRKWVDAWIGTLKTDFLYRGIHLLPERWAKVVESKGHYF